MFSILAFRTTRSHRCLLLRVACEGIKRPDCRSLTGTLSESGTIGIIYTLPLQPFHMFTTAPLGKATVCNVLACVIVIIPAKHPDRKDLRISRTFRKLQSIL